jgi:hypothetical protein
MAEVTIKVPEWADCLRQGLLYEYAATVGYIAEHAERCLLFKPGEPGDDDERKAVDEALNVFRSSVRMPSTWLACSIRSVGTTGCHR